MPLNNRKGKKEKKRTEKNRTEQKRKEKKKKRKEKKRREEKRKEGPAKAYVKKTIAHSLNINVSLGFASENIEDLRETKFIETKFIVSLEASH